jgi:hypothetical protein
VGRRPVTSSDTPSLLGPEPVPTIAKQVRQSLQAEEEARCLALEQRTGKRVKRREIKLPRVRVGPDALCQDVGFLERVHHFDYDLTDLAFQAYATRRGLLCHAGVPGSRRWEAFRNHRLSKAAYLADEYFQFAQEYQGGRHQYSAEEMDANWRVICFGRAVLQDCWELFQARHLDAASS